MGAQRRDHPIKVVRCGNSGASIYDDREWSEK
jgi:hypothetical protein